MCYLRSLHSHPFQAPVARCLIVAQVCVIHPCTVYGWNPGITSWGWYLIPTIYRVLAPSQVVGLGISEPSTVSASGKNSPSPPCSSGCIRGIGQSWIGVHSGWCCGDFFGGGPFGSTKHTQNLKPTWQAGKSTMNEDVSPIWTMEDFPMVIFSFQGQKS